MTLAQSLATRLKAQVSAVSQRVYPLVGEQDPTYPFLTYKIRQSFDPDAELDGSVLTTLKVEIEISSWSDDYDAAHSTADSVRTALHGFTGALGGSGGVVVNALSATSEDEEYAEIAEGVGCFVVITTFEILYR